jgi:hypothetical protein
MPSVAYDQSLYRTGFRPAYTDPFAASQMSGIFSPQHLHGMGNFFSREGGSALHGLGAIVPNASILTYQGKWPQSYNGTAPAILQEVINALNADGQLQVRNSSIDASFMQSYLPGITTAPYPVSLTLQVNNGMGFGDANDVISIVRHYVYQFAGQFPIADSIPTMQVPASSSSSGTGQPGILPTGQPSIPGTPADEPTDWGSWLQGNALLIGGLVVAAMVLPKVLGR